MCVSITWGGVSPAPDATAQSAATRRPWAATSPGNSDPIPGGARALSKLSRVLAPMTPF